MLDSDDHSQMNKNIAEIIIERNVQEAIIAVPSCTILLHLDALY